MTWDMILYFLPGLVIAITVHEFSHAWAASLLGDDFARRQGRVSLNPLRHLTPLGTLAILLLPFGWGRPVQINLYNFKRPRLDYLLVSLAGPMANLVTAGICIVGVYALRHTYRFPEGWLRTVAQEGFFVLQFVMLVNIILAVFNLIPIPPLDGSKIWPCLFPSIRPTMGGKKSWLFLVILLALMWTNSFDPMFNKVIEGWQQLVPRSDEQAFVQAFADGMESVDKKDYPAAEMNLTRALTLNDKDPDVWYWRSWVRFERGKPQQALDDFNKAVEYGMDTKDHERFADMLEQATRTRQADDSPPAEAPDVNAESESKSQP